MQELLAIGLGFMTLVAVLCYKLYKEEKKHARQVTKDYNDLINKL